MLKPICFSFLIALPLFTIDLSAQVAETPESICPILVGETFPGLDLKGLDNTAVNLEEVIAEKPTVLIIYRGGWCPYCNRHLSAIGQVESKILELGYQIVAVSPDSAGKLKETAGKAKLNYRLLSDADGQLAKAAGIAFQAPERYGKRLLDWSDGENTGFLPVPSVFILNTQGEILFEYINPDYKKRLTAELLLAVLQGI